MKAIAAKLAAGTLLAVLVPAGALAGVSGAKRPRPSSAPTTSIAASAPAFLPVGGGQKGLPGLLRCRVVSPESLQCGTAPQSAHGAVYVLYGEWHHRGAQDGLIVLVKAPPTTPGAHQTMIASGRLGAIACPKSISRRHTCWPVIRSTLPSGELGIYVREQF